jgi:superfamily I DNA/RNA helicase
MRTTTVRDLGLFAKASNSLRLMTMHGSKGREFDGVGLIDVLDGHVPFYTAAPGDVIEQEGRRLLCVALTRAKTTTGRDAPRFQFLRDLLLLDQTWRSAAVNGKTRPSPFFVVRHRRC